MKQLKLKIPPKKITKNEFLPPPPQLFDHFLTKIETWVEKVCLEATFLQVIFRLAFWSDL